MRTAKILKKTGTLIMALAVSLTSLNISDEVMAKSQNTDNDDTSTYFKANVFDYDQSTVNKATLDMVASDLLKEGFSESTWSSGFEQVYQEKKALMFTNCGSGSGVVSNPYYYGYGWNMTISDASYINGSNAPYNICRYNDIYQGLVQDELDSNGLPVFNCYTTDLFSPDSTDYKAASYKDVDVEFEYDSDSGYYVLDSSKYAYELNDSHTQINKKSGQEFWIFGSGNVHFGMSLAVDFAMTEDGKYNGKDCKFEFMGDDDVWVYVDNKLAIDLGGIHDAESAYIDFASKEVVYTYHDGTKEDRVSFSELGLDVNDNTLHTLKVFYLERGAGNSNCKIKFNMPTINHNDDIIGDFTFVKASSNSKKGIEGAEFTLYSDEACTKKLGTATSDKEGKVKFSDLKTGEYYMVETKVPQGFKSSSVTKYKVTIAGNSKDSLISLLYAYGDKGWSRINDYQGDYSVIYNIPEDKVVFNKTVTLDSWQDRTYDITLDATAIKESSIVTEEVVDKPVDVVLVMDTSYSMYFPSDLQAYDRNGKALDKTQEYYFVSETDSADVYRVYYSSGNWYYVNAMYNHFSSKRGSTLTEKKSNGSYVYSWGRGNTIDQFYTADSSMDKTRFSVLQKSANNFINKLSQMSNDSRVSIVYFNSRDYGVLEDFTSLNEQGVSDLTTAIGSVDSQGKLTGTLKNHIGSGTDQGAGMKIASSQIDKDTSDNDKYVVLLTDGCPTVSNVDNTINGNSGYATLMKEDGVKIISIGVDVHEEYMPVAVSLLKNTASYVKGSDTEKYCYIAESAKLDEIFGVLSDVIRNESGVTKILPGKIVDIIDSRFEIADTSQDSLKDAVIEENDDGTTTITWESDALNGWIRTFKIRAKESYAGGNSVVTNDEKSGVTIDKQFYAFPQPTVNVKINLNVGQSEDEIFLGQSLKNYFTEEQLNKIFSEKDMDCSDIELSYVWMEDEMKTGSLEEFREYIRSLSPETDTAYEIEIIAKPKVSDGSEAALKSADSMKNSSGEYYTASMDVANQFDADSKQNTGIYNVTILSGQIHISKSYDLDHLSFLGYTKAEKVLIDARQYAVFTVYRYAEDADVQHILAGEAKAIESYRLVIEGEGSKTITGLKAGMYRIEESNWTWKYGESQIVEEDSTNDGIIYIGKESHEAEAAAERSISFKNIMTEKGIYSDTTGIVNIFK